MKFLTFLHKIFNNYNYLYLALVWLLSLSWLLSWFLSRFLSRFLSWLLSRFLSGFLSRLLSWFSLGGLLSWFLPWFLSWLLPWFLPWLLSRFLSGFLGGGAWTRRSTRVPTFIHSAPVSVGPTLGVLLVAGGARVGNNGAHTLAAPVPVRRGVCRCCWRIREQPPSQTTFNV